MSLLGGFIVPHPPIIIPDIGKAEENKIKKTIQAYHEIAKKIAALKPKTIIFISPHHLMYKDYFHISPGKEAFGSLDQFGSKLDFNIKYHPRFLEVFNHKFSDFPAGELGEQSSDLDHGIMVPLYFINKYYQNFNVIRISLSGLSLNQHKAFGKKIDETMKEIEDNYVVVASGDLSHKLKKSGPFGFVKEGPIFDHEIIKHIENGDFDAMTNMKASLYQKAAECGLRSFVILGGILEGQFYESNLHSYEGPFGVGYAVGSFIIIDPYVWLAKTTIHYQIHYSKQLDKPKDLPPEMLENLAGVFVSLKKNGHLRGCIGTIRPTTKSIADEIIQNAISAAFHDPRFPPVKKAELENISYSVDILMAPEPIESFEQLDVMKYGVIVKSGHRSGLLLPHLEGVETVEEQVNIALSKAGIYQNESYQLYRFEVIRHK